jgi:2-polyprenyl-3-methyl-5-hydroxy-6-metoxy-1,4-benzoquinol methylase
VSDDLFDRAVKEAAARYTSAGRLARGMMRGKLRVDPVYRELLVRGIADSRQIVDLGCGRGLLFSLILASRGGEQGPAFHGIEIAKPAVDAARTALGDAATIVEGDVAEQTVPACDVVTLLDVAHYLPVPVQDDLLARARAALPTGGRLFVREADAAAGAGFLAVRAAERLAAIGGGNGLRRFAYRAASELRLRLETAGFTVAVTPMGRGTPFSNVLLEARARA